MAIHRPIGVISERRGKWLLNLFPPFLFLRIQVEEFGDGFRRCRVRVRHSRLTRNLYGSTFGGAIFAAADPIYAIMYWQVLARRGIPVQTWLKSAAAAYVRPAWGDLILEFRLGEREIEDSVRALREQGRFTRDLRVVARDRSGEICALLDTEVYLRLPPEHQREVSAF